MYSNDKKQKIIKKAKSLFYQKQISEATSSSQGVWQLAKWARTKSQSPRKVSKMSTLSHNSHVATTFEEKADMLKDKFFPPSPEADLMDIEKFIYPQTPTCLLIITREEVLAAIRRLKADKAPGPDSISNQIF